MVDKLHVRGDSPSTEGVSKVAQGAKNTSTSAPCQYWLGVCDNASLSRATNDRSGKRLPLIEEKMEPLLIGLVTPAFYSICLKVTGRSLTGFLLGFFHLGAGSTRNTTTTSLMRIQSVVCVSLDIKKRTKNPPKKQQTKREMVPV